MRGRRKGQPTRSRGRKIAAVSLWAAAGLLLAVWTAVLGMRISGYELLSVQTDSMAPAIRAGEAVVVDAADRDIKAGDIVSFTSQRNPEVVITHRVVSADWKRGTFIARGDSNDMTDRPVPLQGLRGTVHRDIPLAGYALDALRHPLGITLAVYVPALGIISAEARRLAMYYAGRAPARRVRYTLYARAP